MTMEHVYGCRSAVLGSVFPSHSSSRDRSLYNIELFSALGTGVKWLHGLSRVNRAGA